MIGGKVTFTEADIERGAKTLYSDYGWTSEHGQRIYRENIRRIILTVLEEAGIAVEIIEGKAA